MSDSVDSIFGIDRDFTFTGAGDYWGTSSNGNNGTNLPTNRHHTNPTQVVNKLSVFSDLAQIANPTTGKAHYDHQQFAITGSPPVGVCNRDRNVHSVTP